jgi:radical SAM protein with 4Fe4S-binding SPASM domain
MKAIAIVDADFATAPLGTRSRLNELLSGEPVVRRTLRRVLACKRIASVHLVVPAAQAGAARDAASGLDIQIETHQAGPPLWQRYVASSRKWALDGWRGGITGTTMFDETLHASVAEALTRRESADAVAIVPAAAAIVDPILLDRLVEHYEKVREQVRLAFTQSAPGLSACIYSTPLLTDLAAAGQFIGRLMAYRPAQPQREMNIQPCFYAVENTIAHAAGRCLADTQSGFDRIAGILRDCGENVDAAAASRWCSEQRFDVDTLPSEVEIELTTADPLPDTTLRPRGDAVPARGPMSIDLFERFVSELAAREDARIVLGGFGDPLMHPDWPRMLQCAANAGIFGVAVRTPGVHLDDAAIEQIFSSRVDIVNVLIDAQTSATYRKMHGVDHFEKVSSQIDVLIERSRQPEHQAIPLVIAEMVKTRETIPEMEAFYDHWLNKGCGATIAGPCRHGGRRVDLSVMNMAPPTRFACPRPFHRCMILADGSVTLCDEDFTGEHAIGSLTQCTLGEIWNNGRYSHVRHSHQNGNWDALPLCGSCNEWHRP